MIGAIFIGHPDPQQGTVSFNAEAAIYLKIQFPSSPWCLVDEWYYLFSVIKIQTNTNTHAHSRTRAQTKMGGS